MADNVVSFETFDNELQISTTQSEMPQIVLEGGEDVVLFKRWFFDHLDRFEFVQAANLGVGAGCTAVREAVSRLLERGVQAYGLQDRDRLFREQEWAILFSVDDAEFAGATEEDNSAVNSLWEIEAYVIVPELIPSWVRSHHRNPPASQAECDAAIPKIVEECEHLLRAQCWLATAHRCGVRVPDGKYCDRTPAQFTTHCAAELAGFVDPDDTAAEIQAHVDAVLAHAPAAPAERLRWFLRYVDTKRLMLRLSHRLRLGSAAHKWVLLEFMSLRGLRPVELEERLDAVSKKFLN